MEWEGVIFFKLALILKEHYIDYTYSIVIIVISLYFNDQ